MPLTKLTPEQYDSLRAYIKESWGISLTDLAEYLGTGDEDVITASCEALNSATITVTFPGEND